MPSAADHSSLFLPEYLVVEVNTPPKAVISHGARSGTMGGAVGAGEVASAESAGADGSTEAVGAAATVSFHAAAAGDPVVLGP
ncbi:MAG TPA: hypothetical protein PLL18_10050, partial [Flavobacteriales bacterium]|nr:hypothetical protein [Flavobacteriales bacterium]